LVGVRGLSDTVLPATKAMNGYNPPAMR